MTDTLRIVADVIELHGQPVARLLPIRLSVLDWLTEIFDAIDEDAETIGRLEGRIKELKAQLEKPK